MARVLAFGLATALACASYIEYDGKTAYSGHGGTEIDSDATAPTGLTVASCEARCDADAACSCVSFQPSIGKCWRRGSCVPSQFGTDSQFNTHVKGSAGTLAATTLHWNIHRPCGTDDGPCIAAAQKRLGEMAQEVGAQLVGAVELKNAVQALPGWQSSGMQCDNSAIMVAPGWSVRNSGGFCMNGDSAKGFAVALVQPPQPVQGCSSLCIFMGHVPHGSGTSITGHSEIANVCGGAVGACTIAMGDWNAEDISTRWRSLIGGSPALVEPHDKTCCLGSPGYIFAYDHTATNIAGAYSAGKTVYGPQLTSFADYDEHKPTSVQLRLPTQDTSMNETFFT